MNLVIGASGLVGHHLVELLRARGELYVGTYFQHEVVNLVQLDVRDKVALRSLVQSSQPRMIYLVAAQANVDFCERNPDAAAEINVQGVKNVVAAIAETPSKPKLVFLSSDYVFGNGGPHHESALRNALNVYGMQKAAAECLIETSLVDYLIVRTSWVYGPEPQGKNFVYQVRKAALTGDAVKICPMLQSTPTYAPDLAEAMVAAAQSLTGVVHLAGETVYDRLSFMELIARTWHTYVARTTLSVSDMQTPRPVYAGLVSDRVSGLSDAASGLRRMYGVVP